MRGGRAVCVSRIPACASGPGTPSKAGVEEPCGALLPSAPVTCREEGLVGGLGPIAAGRRPLGVVVSLAASATGAAVPEGASL